MVSTRGRLRRRLFGISAREVTFERRGFPPAPAAKRERLERVGREFLRGYHVAMEEDAVAGLARRLEEVPPELRGFACEGAAMALALRSALSPRRPSRLQEFLGGPAAAYPYTAHVGIGWAHARLPALLRPRPDTLDPLLRWLVLDGAGFHDAYFHPGRVIVHGRVPAALHGYERRAFDQGIGRCLWFWGGARADRTADAVGGFDAARHDDLWSGVGIACAYAGGVDDAELARLASRAGRHAPHLAQGVAFGAKAHERAGHVPASAGVVRSGRCGGGIDDTAAACCDDALRSLADDPRTPAYEAWRARVRERLAPLGAVAADGEAA
jgi:enediyne biosynthesis protein E3